MKHSKKKLIGVVLSCIYPGVGHLYDERYLIGTVGVVLTTWSLLSLLVSLFIFTPSAGTGCNIVVYPRCSVAWVIGLLPS